MIFFEVVDGGGIVKKDVGIQDKILHDQGIRLSSRQRKSILPLRFFL
ncbi:MAG: hypothetical protein WC047_02835 [Kiritimatiellales bacterium]